MHVEFSSIRIKRFRSFEKEASFAFAPQGPGLYFLKGSNEDDPALGSNGSGKSSIVDALLWCLYGRTVMGLRNPDIVPWHGKGQTEVQVFVKVDKKAHDIKRTVGPNLLTVDGKEVGQDHVQRLIGIPYEILPFTVILGQRQPLFFDQSATEKLKIFTDCLRLERWETRSEAAKTRANDLMGEISAKSGLLVHHQMARDVYKLDMTRLKGQLQEWENVRTQALSQHDKKKTALEKALLSIRYDRDNADLALERAETELRGSKKEEYYDEGTRRQMEINKAEVDLKHEIRNKAAAEASLAAVDEAHCPTCGKDFDKLQKAEMTKLSRATIKQINSHIKAWEELIEVTKKARDQALEKLEREEAATKGFEVEARNARDSLLRLNKDIAEREAELKRINAAVVEFENQDNPYREQLELQKSRFAEAEGHIEGLQKTIAQLEATLTRTQFWIKGFKDIKLLTLTDILQELQIVTQGMLDDIGLIGWKVTYDIERETKSGTMAKGLHVFIQNKHVQTPVRWEVWSGGEARRLLIVGSCALSSVLLNHVGVTTNLEIYDEPTEGLSAEGIEDLVDTLAQRAKECSKNIWFVDHHVIESSRFTNTVTVIKDEKGSRIQ